MIPFSRASADVDPASPLPRVATLNRLLSALWRSNLAPRPRLDLDNLLRTAIGDDDDCVLEGPSDWRTPLAHLLGSLRDEADLNPLGATIAHALIVQSLRDRRRANRLWARRPEILARPVSAPVVVLGSMRSGTTRIQRLLACDPRFAHTRMFEAFHPVPPDRRPDLRVVRARLASGALHLLNPALAAIHPTGAREPEEEFGLYNFSFGSAQFEAQWRVPSFARWWEAADTRPLHAEFKRLLQTIGWSRGDPVDKPWLLKAPQFMQDLDALLHTFPDARLVCLHRDLAEVTASSASLVWNQMRVQSDSADPVWVGQEWQRKTRLRLDRAGQVRMHHRDVPQIDVEFEAMNADWRREMRRIYGFLGLALTPEVERRMADYLSGARSHQGHRYSPRQFGLAEQTPQ